MWKNYTYNTKNIFLRIDILKSLNNLFNDHLKDLEDDQVFLIMFKLKTVDNLIYNISKLQIITKKDLVDLKAIILEYWELKSEEYNDLQFSSIIYDYKILDQNNKSKIKTKLNKIKPKFNSDFIKNSGYRLPRTMDIYDWGNVQIFNEDKEAIVYKFKSKFEYHIKFINHSTMETKYKFNNKLLFTFTDELKDKNNLGTFTRKLDNYEYHFENGNLLLKSKIYKTDNIKKIGKKPIYINRFLTMDLETITIDNTITPYCVCIYHKEEIYGEVIEEKYSFYLNDYNNYEDMLIDSIKCLMKRKYHGYKIYLHNFSKFDGIFLLKILPKLTEDITPIIKDGNIINIRFKFAGKYILYFRDSYLMLPSSLNKLCKCFNVEDKGLFPYSYSNIVPLNYNGEIPDINYFDGITRDEYEEYKKSIINNVWNLREETIKYCLQDCKILYEVIEIFSKQIYSFTNINMTQYPTLSSLAFGIYRSNYMVNENIPNINNKNRNIYHFIKEGFSGGAVDMYKPYGTKIYRYDVNSLYPYIMKNYPMPIGNPIYFNGNILDVNPNFLSEKDKFSFLKVKVYAPNNINHPILLTNKNNRKIAPVGTWTGTYTNIEINKALELGYKFEIISGVYFNETKYIFEEYVDTFYSLKKNSNKESPMYLISKLLLNSLYGRFGMSLDLDQNKIINEDDEIKYLNSDKYDVNEIINLSEDKSLISYNYKDPDKNPYNYFNNLSVPIAAAITAYARIYMSQFKNNSEYNLFYTDTDSIDIDKPLPDHMVGNELGQMKLEHIFDEGTYLAPKLYGGKTSNGKEIIKIKGSKNKVSYEELKTLLNKDHVVKTRQDKWYKNISEGNIKIKNEIYTIQTTDNKRELVYKNNILVDTKPFLVYLNDGANLN